MCARRIFHGRTITITIFYKIFSTFTFESLVFEKGTIKFTHPDNGGKFHFFNVFLLKDLGNNFDIFVTTKSVSFVL